MHATVCLLPRFVFVTKRGRNVSPCVSRGLLILRFRKHSVDDRALRSTLSQPHPASCPRAAALASRIQSGASGARVPAGSLGFFVWPDAQLPACAKQRELESVCKAARA